MGCGFRSFASQGGGEANEAGDKRAEKHSEKLHFVQEIADSGALSEMTKKKE